jgi:hypothetical protein
MREKLQVKLPSNKQVKSTKKALLELLVNEKAEL